MSETQPAPADGPTPEQRQALGSALHAKALAERDPLTANLTAFSADLALIAHALMPIILAGPANRLRAFGGQYAADCDLYLKLLRQFDRFAQLQRPATGTGSRGRAGPAPDLMAGGESPV